MAKVVFLGTPEYGVPVLRALAAHHDVLAVVTRPDRPVGRGRGRPLPSAVKRAAEALGIEVLQPAGLRPGNAATTRLSALGADVWVLAAYGGLLREEVLSIPPYGVIGVHASLLPRWRGAAPVPAAILAGDAITGVTLMRTGAGMDTGPIIAARTLAIEPEDTTATLTARLAELGAALVVDTLPAWLSGEAVPAPQDETLATVAPPLRKDQGWIDWRQPADVIARQVRAFTPWPGSTTRWRGTPLRVLSASVLPRLPGEVQPAPGTVVAVSGGAAVAAGAGAVVLREVQLAGRRPLAVAEFLRGAHGFVGSVLPDPNGGARVRH